VFENRVLRRMFEPKRDEVTGGWRKLHNEELHNLYSSPSIIRMINLSLPVIHVDSVSHGFDIAVHEKGKVVPVLN
jgi:hypothetical protein